MATFPVPYGWLADVSNLADATTGPLAASANARQHWEDYLFWFPEYLEPYKLYRLQWLPIEEQDVLIHIPLSDRLQVWTSDGLPAHRVVRIGDAIITDNNGSPLYRVVRFVWQGSTPVIGENGARGPPPVKFVRTGYAVAIDDLAQTATIAAAKPFMYTLGKDLPRGYLLDQQRGGDNPFMIAVAPEARGAVDTWVRNIPQVLDFDARQGQRAMALAGLAAPFVGGSNSADVERFYWLGDRLQQMQYEGTASWEKNALTTVFPFFLESDPAFTAAGGPIEQSMSSAQGLFLDEGGDGFRQLSNAQSLLNALMIEWLGHSPAEFAPVPVPRDLERSMRRSDWVLQRVGWQPMSEEMRGIVRDSRYPDWGVNPEVRLYEPVMLRNSMIITLPFPFGAPDASTAGDLNAGFAQVSLLARRDPAVPASEYRGVMRVYSALPPTQVTLTPEFTQRLFKSLYNASTRQQSMLPAVIQQLRNIDVATEPWADLAERHSAPLRIANVWASKPPRFEALRNANLPQDFVVPEGTNAE